MHVNFMLLKNNFTQSSFLLPRNLFVFFLKFFSNNKEKGTKGNIKGQKDTLEENVFLKNSHPSLWWNGGERVASREVTICFGEGREVFQLWERVKEPTP